MEKLTTVTPKDIEDLTKEEILELVEDKKGLPSKRNRCKIIEMVYEILGFDLSNDVLLALLKENNAQLCVATAGGGKTTFAQIKILLEKLWRKSKNGKKLIDGNNILCLVYNKHNKRDMINKQKFFVNEVNVHTPSSIHLDTNINACTMHAFCNLWANTYVIQMGLSNWRLMTDVMVENSFKTAITVAKKKLSDDLDVNLDDLIQLYNYHRETMLSISDLTEVDKFIDLGLPVSSVELIFNIFNSIKRQKHVYDFTDMLQNFYDLIKNNDVILNNIRGCYDYIVADEVQDFTPIMWKILQLLVDDGTPLLCIGDEDQNIYSFRGANIYDTLHFNSIFKDAETFVLSRNRRCRKEILDLAKNVINKNSLRFEKEIKGVKDGGDVKFIPYLTQKGEYLNVIKTLKKYDSDELSSTVIAYREKDTSAIFIEYLANADIPFYVISGYKPYSHELYKHLINILDLMQMPADSNSLLNLYKILPISKNENYSLLDYNPATFSFGPNYKRDNFYHLDYGPLYNRNGFSYVMQDLINISKVIDTEPLKNYFPKLFSYFKSYYWEFKKKLNNNAVDDLFEEYIFDLFNSDLTYDELSDKLQIRKDILNRYENTQSGLAVSTFHGLKGLEFDTVYLLNLDDSIFPNYPLIDSKEYNDEVKLELKEAERRLFYVAVTRAKNNLFLYFSSENPSIFIQELLNDFDNVGDEFSEILDTNQDQFLGNELCIDESSDELIPNLDTDLDIDTELELFDAENILKENKNGFNSLKTDTEFKNEIKKDLEDVTEIKVGPVVTKALHTDSVNVSSLKCMNFETFSRDKDDEKRFSESNFVNKLFAKL